MPILPEYQAELSRFVIACQIGDVLSAEHFLSSEGRVFAGNHDVLGAIFEAPDTTSKMLTQSNCDKIVKMLCTLIKRDRMNFVLNDISHFAASTANPAAPGSAYYMISLLKHGCLVKPALYDAWSSIDADASHQSSDSMMLTVLETNGNVHPVDHAGRTALHYAAEYRIPGLIWMLVRFGAAPNSRDHTGMTPLQYASNVRENDKYAVKMFKEFITECDADVNAVDRRGRSVLFDLVPDMTPGDCCSTMISSGADVNVVLANGLTLLLQHSCVYGMEGVCTQLVTAGADVHVADRQGNTTLHHLCYSAKNRMVEVVKLCRSLVDAKADINIMNQTGVSPLDLAVYFDYPDIVSVFTHTKGVDTDAANTDIQSHNDTHVPTLIDACKRGDAVLVKTLVATKANLTNRDYRGFSALDIAIQHGNNQIASMIFKAKPSVSISPQSPLVSLMLSRFFAEMMPFTRMQTIKQLISDGADINQRMPYVTSVRRVNGLSPLHAACLALAVNVVPVLLNAGADVNVRDDAGRSSLHMVSQTNFVSTIFHALIDAGGDLNDVDNSGHTPLIYACKHLRLDTVDFLIKAGASLNVVNNRGESLVQYMCRKHIKDLFCLSIVDLLLNAGLDVTRSNYNGLTVLHTICDRDEEISMWPADNSKYLVRAIDHAMTVLQ